MKIRELFSLCAQLFVIVLWAHGACAMSKKNNKMSECCELNKKVIASIVHCCCEHEKAPLLSHQETKQKNPYALTDLDKKHLSDRIDATSSLFNPKEEHEPRLYSPQQQTHLLKQLALMNHLYKESFLRTLEDPK